jgi:hypothetical protein
MDQRAIDKGNSRLRVAKKALEDLRASETFREFSDNWYIFLTSAKNVYTVLEQGAKSSPQSRQWFSGKQNLRRSDPLLQYLYEARNDDEHGLGSSVGFQPETYEFGISKPGYSNTVVVNGGPFKDVVFSGWGTAVRFQGTAPPPGFEVTPLDGQPVLNRATPATTILVEISARGGRKYVPPTMHLGLPLNDTSPIGAATVALVYLDSLLEEASKLA